MAEGVAVDGAEAREYRVDDLARAAGTSVRNVRVYQDRGLLPPPRRQGRIGWYSGAHLERLLLIGRLLERGYTFATIAELLDAHRHGGLQRVLGLEPPRLQGDDAGLAPSVQAALRPHLTLAAQAVVDVVAAALPAGDAPALAETIGRLTPFAAQVAEVTLAEAMQRQAEGLRGR